jgi:hypothetical protein
MALAAWMADVVEFVRDRPRLAAAAAIAFLAIVAPIWWLGPQRGAAAPSRADQTAASSRVPDKVLVPPPPPTARLEQCASGSIPVIVGSSQLASDMEAAQSAADSALARLPTELAARSTDRDHALGLYLQMVAAPSAASYEACGGDYAACQQALSTAIAETQGALVRIATHTSDSDAYALAVYSCMWLFAGTRNADCDLLSYAQWAGIEPDNAVPWLYLAGDAQRHGDQSTVGAALYRASKARFSNPHLDQISGLVYSNAAAALSPTFQTELAGTLLSIQGGLPHPNLSVVMRYCGDAGQTVAGHVQTCGDLAAMLVERSRTAIEVLVGGRVAEQVSWANPRLAPLRDEADAMRWQLFRMPGSQQAQMLPGCDSTQRLLAIAAAQAQFGESGRLRQELAARGVTTAQAAEAWRAARRWPR